MDFASTFAGVSEQLKGLLSQTKRSKHIILMFSMSYYLIAHSVMVSIVDKGILRVLMLIQKSFHLPCKHEDKPKIGFIGKAISNPVTNT